jgi:hypothetical protein
MKSLFLAIFVTVFSIASFASSYLECTAKSVSFKDRRSEDGDMKRVGNHDWYVGKTKLHSYEVNLEDYRENGGWYIEIRKVDDNSTILASTTAYFSKDRHNPIDLFGRDLDGSARIHCYKRGEDTE